jgi:hypothetical protein
MPKTKCSRCGVRVSVDDESESDVLCASCEAVLDATLASSRDDDGQPRRKKKKKKKQRSAAGRQFVVYGVSLSLPRLLAIGVASILVIVVGVWMMRSRDASATRGPAGGKQVVDKGFEKIAWNVPFGGEVAVEPLPRDMKLPKQFFETVAFGQTHANYRKFVAIGPGPYYYVSEAPKLRQGRFDRKDLRSTERPLGDQEVEAVSRVHGGYMAVAGTADGRAAVVTRAATVVVWGPEGEKPQCTIPLKKPVPQPQVILGPFDEGDRERSGVWVGWAGSRVLYLDGGNLVAFDPAAKREQFSVGGQYQRPIVVAPNGKWVITTVGKKHLEVIDVSTGDCLGRFGGRGDWHRLALSPDGKRLAMTCVRGKATTDLSTWIADLSTGGIELVQSGYGVDDVAWLAPDKLVLIGPGNIYDLAKKRVEYRCAIPSRWAEPGPQCYGVRGDGKLLFFDRNKDDSRGFRIGFPEYPKLDIILGPKNEQPIQVVVDAPDDALKAYFQECAEESLKERDYRLGVGGWKVAINGKIVLIGTIHRKFRLGGKTSHQVPGFVGKLRLIDPQNTTVFERDVSGGEPAKVNEHFYDDLAAMRRRKSRGSDRMLGVAAEMTAINIEEQSWPPIVVRTDQGPRVLPILAPVQFEPIGP